MKKYKKYITKNNIILLIVSVICGLSALHQFLDAVFNHVFNLTDIVFDGAIIIGQNFFPKEYIYQVVCGLIALAAVILFVLRKKIGWILTAVFMVWSIISFIFYQIEYCYNFIYRVNLLNEFGNEWLNDQSDTWNEVLPAFIRLLCVMVITCAFHGALLWLICLKRIRNIYKVGVRGAVLTIGIAAFLGLTITFVFSKNAGKSIKIEQIASHHQVVIKYNNKHDKIDLINFPFAFEFKNNSLISRYIDRVDYFYHSYLEDDYSPYCRLYYNMNNELVNGYEIRRNARLSNILKKPHIIVVESYHEIFRIDTTNAIQRHFQPYVERIKQSDTDTLHIGTIQEFVQRHPQLAETLLKADSITFRVDADKRTWYVDLPIKYSLTNSR
jgi:hypothetical protein